VDFDFSPEQEAFREEVRAFIAENLPPESERGPDFQAQWDAKLAEKKWLGFALPEEEGGGGGTLIEQFILKEEMSKAQAPALGRDFMGLTWVAPALIRHGTEEQKRRFLPELLNARSYWCTGLSEPDVGSDLASVRTRAVRDGNDYVINGSKIWTSYAHEAEWIYMLVCTDPEAESRYKGTSCMLVPLDTEGIEIRPIINIAGIHHFNQLFFTDVRVPVENRLGAEGDGWRVAMGSLADERSGISEAHVLERKVEALKELANDVRQAGTPVSEDTELRRKFARYETLVAAMRLNGLRNLTQQMQGKLPGAETSVNKLLRGYLEIPLYDTAMGLLGHDANTWDEWQEMSLRFHSNIIGGGSPNIQRNIIAERLLGLPKD
jgi:alkylation response protein AidB-like acyl-CoA dehydrogenase